MADGDTIKTFQVGLKFVIDQSGKQSFDESLRKGGVEVDKLNKQLTGLTKSTVELGRSGVLAGIGFAKAIETVTKNYQQLYYSAQQAQVSAKELGGLEAGFRAFGASGSDAAGAIQSMTLAMKRSGGGLEAWTRQITGVDVSKIASGTGTATERMKEFNALIDWMAKQTGPQGEAIRAQVGQMYGWSQSQIELWIANKDRMRRGFEDFQKVMKEAGVDVDALAKKSADYQETLSGTTTRFSALWSQTAQTLLPVLQPMTEQLNKLLDLGIKWEKENPWAGAALTFAGMAGSAELILKAVKGLAGAAGLGGAAKEAEVSATGIGAAMGKGFKAVAYGAAAFEAGYSIGDAARKEIEKTELGKGILESIGKGIAGLAYGPGQTERMLPQVPENIQKRIDELNKQKTAGGGAGAALPPATPEVFGPPAPPAAGGGGFWDRAKSWLPKFQGGGVVTAQLHAGEMVLPPALSQGIQDMVSGGGAGGTATRKMSDWLSGSAGMVPRVKIDNSEELAQAMPGAMLPGGGPAGTAAWWGGAGGAGAGGGGAARWFGGGRGAAAEAAPIPSAVTAAAETTPLPEIAPGTAGGPRLGEGGPNPFLAKQRAPFGEQLKQNPMLMKQLAAIVQMENPEAGTEVVESLFNRMARTHGTNIAKYLFGGFYGPVNRGQMAGMMQRLARDPKLLQARLSQIYQALGGSDLIKGYTDQGSRTATKPDPNYIPGGIGINIERGRAVSSTLEGRPGVERFNLYGGDTPANRAWRAQQEAQVEAARRQMADGKTALAAPAVASRPLGAPEGGGPQLVAGGAVSKTVSMQVNHTVNITTPQGTPGEHVRAWAGAQKRHFADLHRNLQSAMS